MNQEAVIQKVTSYLQVAFGEESTGHDWYHIDRVRKNALLIQATEGGDAFVTELGALLHDIADHKFVANADQEAVVRTRRLLAPLGIPEETILAVLHIIAHCSFKGGIGENKMQSLEGKIVQDADRLDAIGAIGIARTFAYGGKSGNMIYDPKISPTAFKTAEEYQKTRTHTINHFYEKLLLLKDRMNTPTGTKLANERHTYMEEFLNQFYAEWKGEK